MGAVGPGGDGARRERPPVPRREAVGTAGGRRLTPVAPPRPRTPQLRKGLALLIDRSRAGTLLERTLTPSSQVLSQSFCQAATAECTAAENSWNCDQRDPTVGAEVFASTRKALTTSLIRVRLADA